MGKAGQSPDPRPPAHHPSCLTAAARRWQPPSHLGNYLRHPHVHHTPGQICPSSPSQSTWNKQVARTQIASPSSPWSFPHLHVKHTEKQKQCVKSRKTSGACGSTRLCGMHAHGSSRLRGLCSLQEHKREAECVRSGVPPAPTFPSQTASAFKL